MTSMDFTLWEEQRGMHTQQAARLEPVYPRGISAIKRRTISTAFPALALPLSPSHHPRTRSRELRAAEHKHRHRAAPAPFVPHANPTSETCHIFLRGEA